LSFKIWKAVLVSNGFDETMEEQQDDEGKFQDGFLFN
jgi:hypothetical protein